MLRKLLTPLTFTLIFFTINISTNVQATNIGDPEWVFRGDFSRKLRLEWDFRQDSSERTRVDDYDVPLIRSFSAILTVPDPHAKEIFVGGYDNGTFVASIRFGLFKTPPEEVIRELAAQRVGKHKKLYGSCDLKDRSHLDKFLAIFVQAGLVPTAVAQRVSQEIKNEAFFSQESKAYKKL